MNDNLFLSKIWAKDHYNKVSNRAGPRYTPKLNVDLPIAEIFDGISRNGRFYKSIRTHYGKLSREFNRVSSKYENKEVQSLYKNFKEETIDLFSLLEQQKEYCNDLIPWKKIKNRSSKAVNISWKLSSKLREEKERLEKTAKSQDSQKTPSQDLGSDIHYLYECQKELRYFQELSTSTKAGLANTPFLLLTGIAGTGKTHLLCDVLKGRLIGEDVSPSVMCFGEHFKSGEDLLNQISYQSGVKLDQKHFLKCLDSSARKNKSRALLIVDALNETRINNFWKTHLPTLISEVKRYPNIALVVSCRTGFEKEVMTAKTSKKFVKEDHPGFRFKEWEAISKFFHEFKLPLPEIPLLTPEFQNPLFLLLFCKAFRNRKNKTKKQIFKGHEGATYIFESFVDSVSKKIAKQFSISNSPGSNIWDCIIEKVAEEMVNSNDERISEDQLSEIVAKAYPQVSKSDLIQSLERNLLIVKTPRYSTEKQKYEGYDFRFPFQKFSDHLIGRYLFKNYESEFSKKNKNLNSAKKFFSRRRKLGKFLFNSWNRGIVEALSIQCPEQLKGIEFFEVAPYLDGKSLLSEAFVESVIWRRPDAFSDDLKKVKEFVNLEIITTESGHHSFINALLSVAPIPSHPFNSLFFMVVPFVNTQKRYQLPPVK